MAIKTFADRNTALVISGGKPNTMASGLANAARRRLMTIDEATRIDDLRLPPSNRLHALTGKMSGRWSVSINTQWRVTFEWRDGDVYDVLIEDYH